MQSQINSMNNARPELSQFILKRTITNEEINFDVGKCLENSEMYIYFSETMYRWNLDVYPQGDNETNKNYISIILTSKNEFEIKAKIHFYVLNKKNNFIYTKDDKVVTMKFNSTHKSLKFLNTSEILNENNLLNNPLDIFCSIDMLAADVNIFKTISMFENKIVQKTAEQNTLDEYEQLFNDQAHIDVMFIIDTERIGAHKLILRKKKYFRTMMNFDNLQQIDEPITVEDIEANVFREILRFIYCGKVHNFDQLALMIYAGADRYDLEDLKNLSHNRVMENLTIGNAVACLKEADKYSFIDLKAEIIQFIVHHGIQITSNRNQFRDIPPELILDLLNAMALQNKRN